MRCADFEAQADELLDERRSPWSDPALRRHLENCFACRQRQATLSDALELLSASKPAVPADDLPWRVLEATRADRPAWRTVAWRRARWTVAALAATLFVGITLESFRGGGRPHTIPIPAGQEAVATASNNANTAVPNDLSAPVDPTALAAEALNRDRALLVTHPSSLVPPSNISPAQMSTAQTPAAVAVPGAPLLSGAGTPGRFLPPLTERLLMADQPSLNGAASLTAVVSRLPGLADDMTYVASAQGAEAVESLQRVSHSLEPVALTVTETWQILKQALPPADPSRG